MSSANLLIRGEPPTREQLVRWREIFRSMEDTAFAGLDYTTRSQEEYNAARHVGSLIDIEIGRRVDKR